MKEVGSREPRKVLELGGGVMCAHQGFGDVTVCFGWVGEGNAERQEDRLGDPCSLPGVWWGVTRTCTKCHDSSRIGKNVIW